MTPITSHTWTEVPDQVVVAEPQRWPSWAESLLRIVGVAVVAALGPMQRVAWVGSTFDALIVLVASVMAAAVIHVDRKRRRLSWALPIIAVTAVGVAVAGPQVGFWFGAGLGLAAWADGRPPPIGRWASPEPASLVGLIALAWWTMDRGRSEFGWRVPFTFVALGVILMVVLGRWPDLPRRAGHALANGVRILLFTILGVVVVGIPGVVRRVAPARMLRPASASTNWTVLERRDTWPGHLWMPSVVPPRSKAATLGWAVALLAVAMLGATIAREVVPDTTEQARNASPGTARVEEGDRSADAAAQGGTSIPSDGGSEAGGPNATEPGPGEATTIPAAYEGEPWWPRYAADIEYSYQWTEIFREVGYRKVRDGRLTYLTFEDGMRRTWRAPSCACRRLTVWMYGSATAMGLGQRDDHTIASQLAQLAWDEGVALDIENKAMPGDQFWRQVDRFAWDLTGAEPPDLVLFYLGVTDVNAAVTLDANALGDQDWPDDLVTRDFMESEPITQTVEQYLTGGAKPPPAPRGVEQVMPAPAADLDPDEVGQVAATRVGRYLESALALAADYEVEPLLLWEPMRLGRPPVAGEPVLPDDRERRAAVEAANAAVAEPIVDLSDVFVSNDRPLYYDDVHHNEVGARLVAEAIWAGPGAMRRLVESLG